MKKTGKALVMVIVGSTVDGHFVHRVDMSVFVHVLYMFYALLIRKKKHFNFLECLSLQQHVRGPRIYRRKI